jgi:hypothetical protein
MIRFAKISRVDKACPSAARGLPDFLMVSQAASNAEASIDVVSGSNEPFPNSGGRLARVHAAVKKHPDRSETGYFLAVEAAFENWEAMQNASR